MIEHQIYNTDEVLNDYFYFLCLNSKMSKILVTS